MTKKMNKTYKYIDKLINRITTCKSNNMYFTYYEHLVELSSGTKDYVSATIYKTVDRYKGEMADFSYDYWTHHLHFHYSGCKVLTERIINAFKVLYSPRQISISYNKIEYEDEDTTYEYDEEDENKLPVKHLNR